MWPGWQELDRASALAEVPFESLPLSSSAIQMLFAADLEWDRLQGALDAGWGAAPIGAPWVVEAHFFLIAADNARDRLAAWATVVDEVEAQSLAARLDNKDVKDFRHHQEHLEERMPGGNHQAQAQLSAPGNEMIRIDGLGSVVAMNLLRERRFLSFGDREVDLAAAHATILEVAGDLLRWFSARSRFPT